MLRRPVAQDRKATPLPMKVKLEFSSPKQFPPASRKAILKAAKAAVSALPKNITKPLGTATYTLTISLVTDSAIHKLNKAYRKKDKPTDVLSFSRLESESVPTVFPEIGDVIISYQTAGRQAKEYGSTLNEEFSRLTVHGVLHLFGYDHEISLKEEKRMFRLQENILRKL